MSTTLDSVGVGCGLVQEVLMDGILAMVLDLALQFAGTVSVYVAAYVSLQDLQ